MGDTSEKIDVPPRTHNIVKIAEEGFGKNAAAYDAHRPGYTDETIQLILEEILLPEGSNSDTLKYEILELGAGTGKLTELVAPKIPTGYRYLASEPSENFYDLLKAKALPVDTAIASASRIPVPDNSVQNILCGQCIHWFCDEESLKEINRVLVPGGKLIPVANIKKFEEGTWMMEFYTQRLEVMERTGSSKINWVNSMEWKKVIEATGLFTTARHATLSGIECPSNLDTILKHFGTISCYNILPKDECKSYMDQLKEKIVGYPNVNPDDMAIPYNSLLYVFTAK